MKTLNEVRGAVLAGGTVLLLGRIARVDGQLVTATEVSALTYRVVRRDPCCSDRDTVIEGHADVSLAPSAVLFDTLQADPEWEVDAAGYNFRHEVDITADPAFPNAGRSYAVRYELTPLSGQPIVFRFLIEAI